MKNLTTFVPYLWTASAVVQLFVAGLLIARGHFRRLPFFTAYILLNIGQAGFLYVVYRSYGFNSHMGYVAAWWSEAMTLVARVFATIEILHLVLTPYRGIWGLAWRLLAASSSIVLMVVLLVFAVRRDVDWALMESDRGFHLVFAAALIACLALIRYYRIPVDAPYRILLMSFCFYSCVKVLINTALQGIWYRRFAHFEPIWQITAVSTFLIVLIFWAGALAFPLPEVTAQRAVLPTEVYANVLPEIQLQLRELNARLMTFWKIE